MKNSGIEWIGEIPEDWEIIKGKILFKQRNERGNNVELQLLSPTQSYGVIPQNLYEQLSGMNAVKINENVDISTFKTIRKGDFCISLRSFQGGFEYSEYEGVVSPAYQVFYAIFPLNLKYYKYLFKDKCFIAIMNSFTLSLRDGKNIAYNDFANTYVPYPTLNEQQKIANYLDKKCAVVYRLIANQQEQIEKLKEYKQSVITEAVTKGLDKTVPLKSSGVEWIGDIPKGWEVCRIKDLFELRNERNYEELNKVNLISLYTELGVMQHSDIEETTGNKAVKAEGYKLVYKDDIVVNIILCWMGAVGKSNYKGVTSPAYDVYKPNSNASSDYYHYLFRTTQFNGECYRYGRGIMMMRWRTYSSEFRSINVPFPPFPEQQQIAEYLDKKCAKIDKLISLKQQKIDKLTEYKKSLIYEYVTGKKEVG